MILEYFLIAVIACVILMLHSCWMDTIDRDVVEDIFNSVLAGIFFPITIIIILVKIYKRISEWL